MNITRHDAVRVAATPDALIAEINRYLADPSLDRDGRRKVVLEQCQFLDGRAAERVAEAVVEDLHWSPAATRLTTHEGHGVSGDTSRVARRNGCGAAVEAGPGIRQRAAVMRVTYLMRCLAMMRGGGETQHLAWMRALRRLGVDIDIITGQPLLGTPVYSPEPDLPTTTLRSPYMRDVVYSLQSRRGFGRLTMWALHGDEELFCRLAFNRIAARRQPPDLVLAHALHQAPRLAPPDYPIAVYLPGPPHARYVADLQRADGLISDGWAAKQLPAMIGRPVYDVLKGVDVDTFTPDGASLRAAQGLDGTKVDHLRDAAGADQEPADDARGRGAAAPVAQ